MINLEFKDQEHEIFFKEKCSESDVYKNSLVYLIGLTADTRNHFSEILIDDGINSEIFQKGWLTGETTRLLTLGYNLWNGYVHEEENRYLNRVDNIFSGELAFYYLQAVNIRFDIDKKQQRLN